MSDHYLPFIFFLIIRKEVYMGKMVKEITVDIPDWCDGCRSFDLSVKSRAKDGVKIFSCSNLVYCTKARKALEKEMANAKVA